MKKILIIGLPLLIVGGGGTVFTLGKLGIVNIPGVTPPKKVAKAEKEKKATQTAAKKPKKRPAEPEIEATVKPVEPQTNPNQGHAKIAKLWNEMEVGVLKSLTADWKDSDLAPILQRMDNTKVAEFISLIAEKDAKRADRITKALQTEASKI